ncbi:ATP-dependent helicase [Caulobacter sp. 17J65-9]|uniref:UvrD-helicase domain-containing protein n=1 Tax=Caulobacter sp. 17J65-9 TaxID=2709382 RepID=UPI0013C70A38|nr:ATP-dependent helicase [Caulobacter sp. 17J65-9]
MSDKPFIPTDQQKLIIAHSGSAFIAACPGAGKTKVMVERARQSLSGLGSGRGVAFLSFTLAAVSELEDRLRREGLIDTPPFPHFIGTFDSFLWQLLIAPFGIDGCAEKPRLIPDKDARDVLPYDRAQVLKLECFDRTTGVAIEDKLRRANFRGNVKAHETAARNLRQRLLDRGELDFADAREIALARLRDPACGAVLAPALAGRFQELVVDEAQDCNPVDLEIITWFRNAGTPVKVICDPNQAIYGFRGGVTRELTAFAATFPADERMPMSGNFRSSQHIARAIVALRPPTQRALIDEALGEFRDEPTEVQILAYKGGVPASIGVKFRELTNGLGLVAEDCPVVAATRRTGSNALGHPPDGGVQDLSYRLAVAVSDFHFSFELGGRKEALEAIHRIMLQVAGRLGAKTYHQHLSETETEAADWRPEAMALADALRFSAERFATAQLWLDEARRLLEPLLPAGGGTIKQKLRWNDGLSAALAANPTSGHPARTIHSVKGMEFPAVCVVMTTTAKGILDTLSAGGGGDDNEDARKIYVGASRAQRLLVIALPRTQAERLRTLMVGVGAGVVVTQI